MFRPSALRVAAVAAPTRAIALRRAPLQAFRPVTASRQVQTQSRTAFRTYATTTTTAGGAPPPPPPPPPSSGGSNTPMLIVLAAIVALGAGGYYFLKPVHDVASITHQTIQTVKEGTGNVGDIADSLMGMAKASLPPGAFAIYQQLSKSDGGINGFLSNLKDKDLQSVLDEVKKHGGDDVKRVVDKVEKRVKDANGKVQDVDWMALAQELKKELPPSGQKAVDFLIGQVPSKEDIQAQIKKFVDIGEDKRKQLEAAAKKVLDEVKKAQKEGKGQADAFLKGLKEAAPADVDSLIKQLKDAAKSAGLPADTAEAWLKSKAEDGKINAEETAKQLQSKLKTASKMIPVEPKELVEQVKQLSPSIAELLAQAMKEAGIVDDKLNRKK